MPVTLSMSSSSQPPMVLGLSPFQMDCSLSAWLAFGQLMEIFTLLRNCLNFLLVEIKMQFYITDSGDKRIKFDTVLDNQYIWLFSSVGMGIIQGFWEINGY